MSIEIEKQLKKILELNPKEYNIYKLLADINYLVKNNPLLTIEYYQKYLEHYPDNEDAKGCLGIAYLKTKNYKKGWEYFEYRPHKQRSLLSRAEDSSGLINSKPLWKGENIQDKTIYVYYEAGYGDTIMFARYLPLLKNKCAKIIFKPQIACAQLFKDCGWGIEVLDKDDSESEIKYDVHTPIMSLPFLLNLNSQEDIPFTQGYLN